MKNFSVISLLSPNMRVVLLPIVIIGVIVALAFYLVNFTISNVPPKISALSEARKTKKILEEKLEILKSAEVSAVEQVAILQTALPVKSSGPVVIGLAKDYAIVGNLNVISFNLKTADSVGEEVKMIPLSLDLADSQDINSIITYLNTFKNVNPITTIESFELQRTPTGYETSIVLNTYEAPLPEKIPSVTEPVGRLSQNEEELMNRISGFTSPQFTTLLPEPPVIREDPFN